MSDVKMITVSTVRQTVVDKAATVEIFTTVRETTDKETKQKKVIPEDQKVRSIIVPHLDVTGLPSKFSVFVSGALLDVAKLQLAAIWKDNPQVREVAAAQFTTDGILAFAAREAESKRLTGDSIKAAVAEFLLTLPEARRVDAQEIMVSMSASAKKGSEVGCKSLGEKLAAWAEKQVEGTDDEPNPVLVSVAAKLTARAEELRIQREAFSVDAGF